MIDLVAPLMSGLAAGLGGSLVGAAVAWWMLRGRMEALAVALRVPQNEPPSLASLRDDMHRLAKRQAAQDDVQIERLHQWQRDLICFLGDSQKRQVADLRALLHPAAVSASTASAAETLAPAAVARPAAPVPRPPQPDAVAVAVAVAAATAAAPPPPARELTDEEIDALPPELPEPTRRKRLAQPPATPKMRGI